MATLVEDTRVSTCAGDGSAACVLLRRLRNANFPGHPAGTEAISRGNGLPAELRRQLALINDSLREMAASLDASRAPNGRELEDMERRLTVMEEKMFAALISSCSEAEMLAMRSEAERALARYRSKMQGAQIEQLQKQFIHRRLLEQYKLPRLSLFYMQ